MEQFMRQVMVRPYRDYTFLQEHCYKALRQRLSPDRRNEHLAILDLIEFYEEYQGTIWTPVSKRHPDENFSCLITVLALPYLDAEEDEGILYPDFVGWDGEAWVNADGCVVPFEVIAWTPAPAPYRAEKEEE